MFFIFFYYYPLNTCLYLTHIFEVYLQCNCKSINVYLDMDDTFFEVTIDDLRKRINGLKYNRYI